MDWWLILLIIFGCLIILMASGLPVAFTFLLFNIVGVYLFWGGEAGLSQLVLSMHSSIAKFTFLPVPMFILLGEVMFQSGLALNMIDTLDKWLGALPGRLGLLAVGSGTLFSTMSGSTMGTTAMLGALLTPEMEKRGYKKPMSIGPVMGSGGLAMLIPPSGLAVVLAAVAEISVGELLISGIIPGLLVAALYTSYIILRCWLQPSIAPPYRVSSVSFSQKILLTLRNVLPMGFIIVIVLGFIFLGIATPTEAAAMGALGSFVLAAIYGKLTWQVVKNSFVGTARVTIMTLIIITGAVAFSQILAFSGATRGLLAFVTALPVAPIILLIAMQVVLIIMGMFMAAVAVMMITIPIFMPIVYALGWDPIWFGLLFLLNTEMSMTTPPFGMLLFVMKGVAPPNTTMGEIIKAGAPFLLCDAIALILIIAFPSLALWLPSMM